MSQRYLDNMSGLSTLPRSYGYHYDKTREATSSLCFRPARAHARAAHHLSIHRDGDESPGSRLIAETEEVGASHPAGTTTYKHCLAVPYHRLLERLVRKVGRLL